MKNDKILTVHDIPFYIDPFAVNYLDKLTIDYNVEQDDFIISSPSGLSSC